MSGRPIWTWIVEGREASSGSPGASPRSYEESGANPAESAGEIVEWLAQGPGSPMWDNLDTDYPFTITIIRSGHEDADPDGTD